MKRTLVMSLLLLAVAALLAGLGTFAYFSDTANSTGNTFSAGTIDLVLSNDGTTWGSGGGNDVSGTWTSPANWAPGQTVDAFLYVKNTGSIDVNNILSKITLTQNDGSLADMIDLVELNDDTSVGSGPFFVTWYANTNHTQDGAGSPHHADVNDDGHLSLAEYSAYAYPSPSLPGYNTRWYCDGSAPDPANAPCLNANGVATNRSGNPYFFIHMKFKLREDAGNAYQNKTVKFDLKVNGQQTWAPGQTGWPAENA